MAAPKLTNEQRLQLIAWLAAEYTEPAIAAWFKAREWPEITAATLTYYRKKNRAQIAALRQARRASALDTGLALKEERVQRLKDHADRLEAMKWEAAENGRYWNEKAWRETLDDIAKEMGHRRQGVDLTLARELEAFLDRLRDTLPEDIYARVLACAAGGSAPGE